MRNKPKAKPEEGNHCYMNEPPFYQCCCNCKHHLADYEHCITNPKLRDEKEACICNIQKGWVCHFPESDRVFSNWEEHSCGCELYSAKNLKLREV